MKYVLIRSDDDEPLRLESDGETIWEYDGGGFSNKDDDFLDAILSNGNFGQPQRDALKALFGIYEEDYEQS